MSLGLSESKTTEWYLDLSPLYVTSSVVLSPILKKAVNIKKVILLLFLDITCSDYLIWILTQLQYNQNSIL